MSAGVNVYKSERLDMRFQVDGQNLTNDVDMIDFGGLFRVTPSGRRTVSPYGLLVISRTAEAQSSKRGVVLRSSSKVRGLRKGQ